MEMTPLQTALTYYKVKEHPDLNISHPALAEMIQWMMGKDYDDSKIAWCSIFMNWVCHLSGYERSGKATARSWMKVGIEVKLEDAIPGDVVIFWRGSPNDWRGHVGIFINDTNGQIQTLGGNQENSVVILGYSKKRLLKIVRLKSRL